MKSKLLSVYVFSTLLLSSNFAAANITSITTIDAPQAQVGKVLDFITTGNDMDGMKFTVSLVDGLGAVSTETGVWNHASGVTGASGWNVTMNNFALSTFYDAWWIVNNNSNKSIMSITIEALPGLTVFDKGDYDAGDPKTFGSQLGEIIYDENSINVSAIYSGVVSLFGQQALRDLWTTLTINFTDTLVASASYSFQADTDNVNLTQTPEPATLLLFGTGILGIFGAAKRKKIS